MPFQLSIKGALDAQKTALDTTINAARDNVKADNVTQIGTQTTSITNAVNTARDAVNTNTDTKTAAVTTAVNAKGVIKSIQRGQATLSGSDNTNVSLNVTIAAVDLTKAMVIVTVERNLNKAATVRAQLTTTTNLQLAGFYTSATEYPYVSWQVVEYF